MAIELTDPSLTTKEYQLMYRYLMDWNLLPEEEPEQEVEPEISYKTAPKKKTRRIVHKWVIERREKILKKVSRNLMRDYKFAQ
jgi:hypothetical protein